MTRLPHPALTWTANLLVPGTGLVLLGRLVPGVVLGLWWGLAVAGLVLEMLVWPDGVTAKAAAGFAINAAAAYGLAQFLHQARRRAAARHLSGEARDGMFRTAIDATLQGRLDDAEAACKALLRLDPDDVEATLHLAALERRRGHKAAARRYLARTRYLDEEGRWDFQVGRELAALDEADEPAAK